MSVYDDPTTWRLQTTGQGIPYRLISRSGTFEDEFASAQETYLIPADRLLNFAAEMFPNYVTGVGGFPEYPARGKIHGTPLYARRITWKAHMDEIPVDPFSSDSGAPADTYQPNCEVTVEFDTGQNLGASSSSDPFTFLEISSNTAGEIINTTAPNAVWQGEGSEPATTTVMPPGMNFSVIAPETEWTVTWPRLPYAYLLGTLMARLRLALGRLNSLVMPIFMNAPAETVMFVAFSAQQQFSWRTVAYPPFRLEMKFLEKHIDDGGTIKGHQYFWRPGVGWRKLLADGTNPVFQTTNLNALFSP